jgi:tetratricopeptide (TPR) repeat protein
MKEEFIGQIELLFTKENNKAAGYHIFFKLLRAIEAEIGLENKMNMEWVFATTEKALKEARKGNVNFSKFYLDEAEKYCEKKNELVINAQNFVILPAKAFYYYNCTKQYREAIEILLSSIKSIDAITRNDQPGMLSASIEQYINICRVFFKLGQKEEAFSELGNLVTFLFKGESPKSHFNLSDRESLNKMDVGERHQLIDHVSNIALEKYRTSDRKDQPSFFTKLYSHLLEEGIGDSEDELFVQYVKIVKFINEPKDTEGGESIRARIDLIPEIYILPRMLQYLFLNQLQEMYMSKFGEEEEISSLLKKYCIEKLHLEHVFGENASGSNHFASPLREIKSEELELVE